ncbi:MAG: putative DNA-binding domain-containing protein [Aquabacterium sp.]|uniref:HvfC/BufC family peptide modification chaperone n=1 Tax=Aquabacterium sp. TaxID=1872578 RepID=UPI0025BD9DC8|nr:putative DNA-binding domain-containing protein [Aquabacterium sp.]MBI5925193.1 putative DNA-binding domain-containing protein [Aquabacterium sp.]
MSLEEELARQQAVLAALQQGWPAIHTARLQTDAAGLRAYQVNARATAQRVLLAHFPTVAAMLGDEALGMLAILLWKQSPPSSGDLGQWGGGLPDLIGTRAELTDWPWLADCARLDWARHLCERAADAQQDHGSLHRLGDSAPRSLRLHLQPCVQVITSPWPLAALWAAHQLPESAQAAAAETALQSGQGMRATVVWRSPWQLQMSEISAQDGHWMQLLLEASQHDGADVSLGSLLNHAPAGFDFSAWLTTAVMQGWLWRITTTTE